MKAVVINEYGDVNNLEMTNIAIPEIAEDEVLVEVKATSINPIDLAIREGYLQEQIPLKFPIVLGWDVAGVITRTGSEVKGFHTGDKILARPDLTNLGTYAQYTAVKVDKLAKLPENVSFQDGAALPLAGLTAWQAINDYLKVEKCQTVLVNGGAGGVGIFAIQILKHIGAKVITTAGPQNIDFLKNLGADQVINYHEADFSKQLSDLDAVFDTVGKDTLTKSFDVLKPQGNLVTIAGQIDQKLADSKQVTAASIWLHPNGKQLTELVNLVSRGIIDVVTDSVHPFIEEGIKEAHRISATHHARGKIVISME